MLQSFGLVDDEAVAISSRSPRPTSRIAENVSVITADDIARINAHTLDEVLHHVPGIQLDQVRTPGSWAFFSINGISSGDGHVLVLIDGVPQNLLGANNGAALAGVIPVQQIERVEIIKGAASAAWGQALGGVINVITKSPDPERPVGGLAAAGIGGNRFTADTRLELTGTAGSFGYYLTGGNLHSDGLNIGNQTNLNHAFGKLTYALPMKGNFTLGLDFRKASYGLDLDVDRDYHDKGGYAAAGTYLTFNYPLAERLSLEVQGRLGHQETFAKWGAVSTPDLFLDGILRQESRGVGAKLFWGGNERNLVAGLEYAHDTVVGHEPIINAPGGNPDRSLDRFSTYLNGAYTLGSLTILPGLRFDKTGIGENVVSYTVGATYQLTDTTLLRAYGARGYSLPFLNIQNRLQQIRTLQVGFETTALPFLWLKGTLFHSDTWRIDIDSSEQTRRGGELEARTSPFYGAYLSGGYTYAAVRNTVTRESLCWIPTNGAKLALNYDNAEFGLRGAITGNYVHWPSSAGAVKDGGLIWDLHLTQQLSPSEEHSPEFFFSIRNIFNGDQYTTDLYKNNPRWFEGGLRFKF